MNGHASTSSRMQPTRRTLVRSAAWSVPVVAAATAAPAFAASCARQNFTMNWQPTNFSRAGYRSGTGTAPGTVAGSVAVSVSLASNSFSGDVLTNTGGNNLPDQTRNLTIPANTGNSTTADPVVTSLGGRAGERGVMFNHASSAVGRGNRQEVTITFSRPVRALNFFITDIDSLASPAYSDRVELVGRNSAGAVVTFSPTPDGVTGTGLQGDPWQRAASGNVSENSAGAQVRVDFTKSTPSVATDVKTLVLTYWNNSGGTQYHRIFLGNMGFSAAGCI